MLVSWPRSVTEMQCQLKRKLAQAEEFLIQINLNK